MTKKRVDPANRRGDLPQRDTKKLKLMPPVWLSEEERDSRLKRMIKLSTYNWHHYQEECEYWQKRGCFGGPPEEEEKPEPSNGEPHCPYCKESKRTRKAKVRKAKVPEARKKRIAKARRKNYGI